ncbi:PREDICTED: uncharacterized protein LOC106292280 [Brassica oleracea var. oleracea]|uniref:uncharacterized protein LOC106292280 n=1 Tax=Brassica oleracea var. oleracea TaxID=109376 RepID=UPI0006A6C012|nr:PREDICTED: uncharacterized protein LOC106292280 [Brassica oleracea var. oleracea]
MGDEVDRRLYAVLDEAVDEYIEDTFNNIVENRTFKPRKHAYVERNREEGHNRLWNDYFSEDSTFSAHLFRRRFRMNKEVFLRIINRLSENVTFFQQRRDAGGRLGLSPLQKCTAAIRMLAYGCAADTTDEYLRLGESTALSCLTNFTESVIQLFGDEYLRRPTTEDLERLLDIGEIRGFPGMIGSIDYTLNDINVLDRSPIFDDILQGRAPMVQYVVSGHQYDMAYYLTDENERNGYSQYDTSEFEEGTSTRSSNVDVSDSPEMPPNLGNMFRIRSHVRDRYLHEQLKYDLIENIWNKFGN